MFETETNPGEERKKKERQKEGGDKIHEVFTFDAEKFQAGEERKGKTKRRWRMQGTRRY